MYTPEEKEELERVGQVFAHYIRDARNLDGQPRCQLVWLDRMQTYVLIQNYSETETIEERDLVTMPIANAEHLFYELTCDIIDNVYLNAMLDAPNISTSVDAEDMVHRVIQKAAEHMEPYMQALPQYREALALILEAFQTRYLEDLQEEYM